MFVFLQKSFACDTEKKRKTSLLDNFRHEETQINDNILKEVVEYKFPIQNDKICLYNVFAFDLATCNVECSKCCEPYADGAYRPNILY